MLVDEDVGGLDVAMEDFVLVEVVKAEEDLDEPVHDDLLLEGLFPFLLGFDVVGQVAD